MTRARRELAPWEAHCLRLDRFDDDPPPRGWPMVLGTIPGESRATSEVSARPRKARTEGQRARFRRNVVIAAAWRQGCSLRLLAEVFDLPRSRVGEIVREVEGNQGPGPT